MNKLTYNLKGKVKLALPVVLVVGILMLVLFVDFAQSTGESYNLIVFYNGSSIPAGWTCISCNVGDPFYNVSIMASGTYGSSGGSDTNNVYTTSGLSYTAYADEIYNGSYTRSSSVTRAAFYHRHTISYSSVTNSTVIPPSIKLKMIRYNNGIPTTLPAGSLVLYNSTSLPSGWVLADNSTGLFIRTENTTGYTGVATSSHIFSGFIIGANTATTTGLTGSASTSGIAHTHTASGITTSSVNNNPVHATFVLIYTPIDTSLPSNMIGMINGTPIGVSANWWRVISNSSSAYYNRFIKINSTNPGVLSGSNYGTETGSGSTNPSGNTQNTDDNYAERGFPMSTHIHSISFTVNSTLVPSYKTVILAQYSVSVDPPQIQLVPPTLPNASIIGEDWIEINITASTNLSQSNISSIKLDWDGSNGTLYPHLPPLCTQSGDTWNCLINKTGLSADTYCFQAYANDTLGQWNATERRCITTGWSSVVMYLFQPSDGTGTIDPDIDFICGGVSFAPMDNVTLYLWNSTNDLVYNITATGAFSYYLNLTDTFTLPAYGLYHWNCEGFDSNGNSSWHGSNYTLLYQNAFVMVTNETYNADTLESGNEPFYITLYRYDPTTNIVPEFYYDGVLDNNTIWSSQGGNYITFRVIKPLDFINPNAENHSFYWSFWYFQGGIPENLNSTNHTQTIYRMILQNNNSGGAVPTLQTQCIDEMTLAEMNCSITDIVDTWPQTSYGEENRQRSFYFSFNTNTSNYTLYRLPDGVANFHTNTEFIASAVGYQQRTTTHSNYVLNNTERNQTIYLLDTNSGIYVSFLVVNQMYTPLTDVDIKVEKRIMGIWVPIMNGATDESGIWTGFLDPTNMHRFTFNKTGYAVKTLSIYPTQSSYTVILVTDGQGSGTLPNNYMDGINITTYPNDMALTPGVDYNFTMNITSQYWELDNYGFNLVDDNHTVLATVTDYQPNGSCVNVVYSCTNQTYVHMDYYFSVNNSDANFTRSWWVKTEYVGNYSIRYLFNDIQALVGTSGLNYFTLLLIAFAITLMLTAALAYVTGLYSPMALMGLITAFTWFWYWIGVIPHDINGMAGAGWVVPVLITFLFVGYAVYENIR
jgi:hypothetical protein